MMCKVNRYYVQPYVYSVLDSYNGHYLPPHMANGHYSQWSL